jgi:hypothetical protein
MAVPHPMVLRYGALPHDEVAWLVGVLVGAGSIRAFDSSCQPR